MKQKIVIYLTTQRIHGVGEGLGGEGVGVELDGTGKISKFIVSRASSPRHCWRSSDAVRRCGPGLFIGRTYWCRLS
jgi:hypothetical protein